MSTEISVIGSIPNGNYFRAEMKQLKEQLYVSLFNEPENVVAKQLNIAGRQITHDAIINT